MEWALAELTSQLEPEPEGGDGDFVDELNEEDAFDEDFESTDDDAQTGYEEQDVLDDESRARRKQKALQSRNLVGPSPGQRVPKRKRSEQEEPVAQLAPRHPSRQSTRAATILNTQELGTKLKDESERRVIVAKPQKSAQDAYKPQAELIKMALDMEETNISSHRNYLATEEARRTQATTIHRTHVNGPRIRWISRAERMKARHYYSGHYLSSWNSSGYGYYNHYQFLGQYSNPGSVSGLPYRYSPAGTSSSLYGSYPPSGPSSQNAPSSSCVAKDAMRHPTTPGFSQASGSAKGFDTTKAENYTPDTSATQVVQASSFKSSAPQYYFPGYYTPTPPPGPQSGSQSEKTWKHTMNYVIHQVADQEDDLSDQDPQSQSKGRSRKSSRNRKAKRKAVIPWEQHMSALFGNHADWGSMRVITRHRPPGEFVAFLNNLPR